MIVVPMVTLGRYYPHSIRGSYRDLIVILEAHQDKKYHLGLGRKSIAKSKLAFANQNRNYRKFEASTSI